MEEDRAFICCSTHITSSSAKLLTQSNGIGSVSLFLLFPLFNANEGGEGRPTQEDKERVIAHKLQPPKAPSPSSHRPQWSERSFGQAVCKGLLEGFPTDGQHLRGHS